VLPDELDKDTVVNEILQKLLPLPKD